MGIGTLWPNQLCVGANYMATDLMQAFNTMLEDVLTNVSYLFPFFFPSFWMHCFWKVASVQSNILFDIDFGYNWVFSHPYLGHIAIQKHLIL